MKVVLIGFMGAGKSNVAKELAKLLGAPSMDTDDLVIERSGLPSITQIFNSKGEAYFRALELQALQESLIADHSIVATGGGILESPEALSLIKHSGPKVVYLRASFSEIEKRLEGDSSRPLFQNKQYARTLFKRREPAYASAADMIVETDNLAPSKIAQLVVQEIITSHAYKTTSNTQAIFVIGDPISHSLSPLLHNMALKECALSEDILVIGHRIPKEELTRQIDTLRATDMRGLIVTMPHKQSMLSLVDQLDESAQEIGAVNTVVKDGSVLSGFNTDWIGIVKALEEVLELKSKRVAIIGAGGTAKAAAYGLSTKGARIAIFNRSTDKARELGERFNADCFSLSEIEKIQEYEIIVNTTSVGFSASTSLLPAHILHDGQVVMDVIYQPFETVLLRDARARGARTVYGAKMFLYQAAEQFQLFTGQAAPLECMRQILCSRFGVGEL